jgi:hypothetical protein
LHGYTFAREHALVHEAVAFRHRAVHRDFFAGLHQHEVADFQFVHPHIVEHVAVVHVRLCGQHFDDQFQRLRCPGNGFHFEPMPQQHDDDERGELPVEIHARYQPEHDCRAVQISHGNGDADERHHAGRAAAQFIQQPGQERLAAVNENDGAEGKRDPVPAGKIEAVPDGVLEHGRDENDWNGQRQTDPEAAKEVANHGGMVVVGGMVSVSACGRNLLAMLMCLSGRHCGLPVLVVLMFHDLSIALFDLKEEH